MTDEKKGILSKFEWFLLFVALAILGVVLLQNQGIHPVETVERTKVSQVELDEKSTPYGTRKGSKDHLNSLADYFAENRANAKATGKKKGFSWASLKIEEDEEDYLKKKYGEPEEAAAPSSCLLYTSPSPRDRTRSRMPSSA